MSTYLHLGQAEQKAYERNGVLTRVDQANGMVLLWDVNYHGIINSHTDLSHSKISYQRNFNQQVIRQTSTGGDRGQEYDRDQKLIPVPAQDLMMEHDDAGHLIFLQNNAKGEETLTHYSVDVMGDRIGERFVATDGHTHQDVEIIRNSNGDIVSYADTLMEAEYKLNLASMRCCTRAHYYVPGNPKLLLREDWYAHDKAGRCIVREGDLKEGVIQISPGKGVSLSHNAAGWRSGMKELDEDGKPMTTEYTYRLNGLLTEAVSSDGSKSKRIYDRAERRRHYAYEGKKDGKTQKIKDSTKYNKNGWVVQHEREKDGHILILTNYTEIDGSGNPLKYIAKLSDGKLRDEAETKYVGYEILKVTRTRVDRSMDHEKHDVFGAVTATYNSQGDPNSVQGQLSESFRLFVTNGQGRIIKKWDGKGKAEYYFYTPDGDMIGRYGDFVPKEKAKKSKVDLERKLTKSYKEKAPKDVNFDLGYKEVDEHFPPPAPSQFSAVEGDSYEEISQTQYEDSYYGERLASSNMDSHGSSEARGGTLITTPALARKSGHNWMGEAYVPYNERAIIGSLYPKMPIPPVKHRHHSFWHSAIEIGIAVAAGILAPELLIGSMGSLEAIMAAGFIGGVASDFAMQETSHLLGDRGHIDFGEMFRQGVISAATAGAANGLGINTQALQTSKSLGTSLEQAAELNAAQQLIKIAANEQHGLSWQSLVLSELSTGMNVGINNVSAGRTFESQLAGNVFRSEFDAEASQALEGKAFDAEQAAATALGTMMGQYGSRSVKDSEWFQQLQARVQGTMKSFKMPEEQNYEKAQAENARTTRSNPNASRESKGSGYKPGIFAKKGRVEEKHWERRFEEGQRKKFLKEEFKRRGSETEVKIPTETRRNAFWRLVDDINIMRSATIEGLKAIASGDAEIGLIQTLADMQTAGLSKLGLVKESSFVKARNTARLEGIRNTYNAITHGDEVAESKLIGAMLSGVFLAGIGGVVVEGVGATAEMGSLSRVSGVGAEEFELGPHTAQEANDPFLKEGMNPPYDASIRPRTIRLQQDKVLVRVYSDDKFMSGRWMMRPKELQGLSLEEIRDKFALPETPTHIVEAHLPKGTYLQVGRVAPQEVWGAGGSWQYQGLNWLDEDLFQHPMPVNDYLNQFTKGVKP